MEKPKLELIRAINTRITQELQLLHSIAQLNLKGDYISKPMDFYDALRLVKERVQLANEKINTKSIHLFSVTVTDDNTVIAVWKTHITTRKGKLMCSIKKIDYGKEDTTSNR